MNACDSNVADAHTHIHSHSHVILVYRPPHTTSYTDDARTHCGSVQHNYYYSNSRADYLLKLHEKLGNGFERFDALDSFGKSSFILGWEEHFDSLLGLAKDYDVNIWEAQKIKLYGDDSSQSDRETERDKQAKSHTSVMSAHTLQLKPQKFQDEDMTLTAARKMAAGIKIEGLVQDSTERMIASAYPKRTK